MNDNIECPQGDLISRAALKQEILPLLSLEERIVIESKIDNAQGYEQEVYFDETSLNHYIEGYREARRCFERPKGEWIFDKEFTEFGNPYGTYRCSVCGSHSSDKYSFCKDCGADMRGEDYEVQDKSQ